MAAAHASFARGVGAQRKHSCAIRGSRRRSRVSPAAEASVTPNIDTQILDSLKYDSRGLLPAIVQDIDSGDLCMQAFADKAALSETLETGLAVFYSRSRQGRWCKGETSGNFIKVYSVHVDCDRDSVIYLGEPIGPSCHTGASTCYFSSLNMQDAAVNEHGSEVSDAERPATTLRVLEKTIQERAQDQESKKSWTSKLLRDDELLCSKITEEAGELCQTLQQNEGPERCASEMADLLYHSMVLLNKQGVPFKDVLKELRRRFGVSGIAEKASRK